MRNVNAHILEIAEGFGARGFDLVRCAQVAQYNELVSKPHRLPDFGQAESLVMVVGNTRALWPRFVSALRLDKSMAQTPDPLDSWVEAQVRDALTEVDTPSHAHFAHETRKGVVGMQRLGLLSGLGFVGPCHLSVHRKYGPWISFRAAVVFDLPYEEEGVEAIDTCAGCARKPCLGPMEDVRSSSSAMDVEVMRSEWKHWLAIREACPIGNDYRFSEAQSGYHYTHERRWLTASIEGSK